MIHRTRGFCRAYGQLPTLARTTRSHRIVRPVQGKGGGAEMACCQPGRQLQQQAAGAEEHGGRFIHPMRQFQPGIEAFGQHHP